MLQDQIELAALTAERDALQKEYAHFTDYCQTVSVSKPVISFSSSVSASKILAFLAEYEYLSNHHLSFGWFKRLIFKFTYGLKRFPFHRTPAETVAPYCQNLYYLRRLAEIEKQVAALQSSLEDSDFGEKMKRYSALSMRLFRSYLAEKYRNRQRPYYQKGDLKSKSNAFVRDYPVILSTAYSLRNSLSDSFIYDYVIIDEASQVDLVTGALALSCARKAVIVGDRKQLPNVVSREQKEQTDRIFAQYRLPEAYRYSAHSLLSSVALVFSHAPRTLLKEHYRCHPEIIGFCNQRFYQNELLILTQPACDRQPLIVYRTAPGNHARDHVNQRQIDVITNEVFPQQGLNPDDGSVGIVTPYRNQANALQAVFRNTAVQADTADKFQGQEKKIIIFSTVDNQIGEFASDPNRLNVAVSRAVEQLIVVTDGNENDSVSPIHDLIGYIQYHNHKTVNSEIHSVFDYLYRNYADERTRILRKYGQVSEIDSENLMYALIRDVLKENGFSSYDVVLHVPLRMIISDLTKLNARELSLATNRFTHVDFLIFSRLTHQPLLVVEVDGFSYHKQEKQQERDRTKDEILKKYSVPILRFSTVGSGEKEQLILALKRLQQS